MFVFLYLQILTYYLCLIVLPLWHEHLVILEMGVFSIEVLHQNPLLPDLPDHAAPVLNHSMQWWHHGGGTFSTKKYFLALPSLPPQNNFICVKISPNLTILT